MIWLKAKYIGLIHKTIALKSPCRVLFWTQAINENGMTFKIINRFVQHGRKILQNIREKYVNSNITNNIKNDITANVRDKGLLNAAETQAKSENSNPYFLNHLLKWVTNSTAAEIRRNAAKKIIYGGKNAVPYLGFVGINLISGQGLVTKEDEIEKVCEDIRISLKHDDDPSEIPSSVSLKDLDLGEMIAKGCNAVVHAGRWKNDFLAIEPTNENCSDDNSQGDFQSKHTQFFKRFHNFNLAVKMMFNYDAESNAFAILKAMHRETIPTKCIIGNISFGARDPIKHYSLPTHPNIVSMHCAFTDSTPLLPEAVTIYPDALPYRLNRDGCGRNMTLFLVMKRYHCNLREYLKYYMPSPTTQLSLFTQLLEAIVHLARNGVAHRDLKTDNILLDLSLDVEMPILVITDFGNAYVNSSLKLQFSSMDVERGGNWALMAPEVKTAIPGPFSIIDYSKSDLWTAATLAYEIFGQQNPFYGLGKNSQFESHLYSESELPDVPNLPKPLSLLLQNMLKQDPSKRPSPAVAANVCHFLLWGPQWLFSKNAIQFSKKEIIDWLVIEAASSILHGTSENTLLVVMRNMFLSRVRMKEVENALLYFC